MVMAFLIALGCLKYLKGEKLIYLLKNWQKVENKDKKQ